MGTKKLKNQVEDLKQRVGPKSELGSSSEYRSMASFKDAWKDGEIESQGITLIFHAEDEPGHLTVLGPEGVGIPYSKINNMGIDAFVKALFERKREKRKGD